VKQLLAWLSLILGAWLAAAPWALGYGSVALAVADAVEGAAAVVASVLLMSVLRAARWPWLLIGLAGIAAAAGGCGVFGAVRPVEILCGLALAGLSQLGALVLEGKPGVIHTKDGKVLVELKSMRAAGSGRIELKGKTFGTMPATMYLTAADLWRVVGLVPLEVIVRLPGLLARGVRDARREAR
jgi:hypothetical protein